MKTMPSLLAPAGNMRALQTALRFGADAVYCGAKQYGLRAPLFVVLACVLTW